VTNISIKMGLGDDDIQISSLSDSIPISIDGTGGYDTLFLTGTNVSDILTIDTPTIKTAGIDIDSYSGISEVKYFTGGGNTDLYLPHTGAISRVGVFGTSDGPSYSVFSLDFGTPLTINCGNGDDTIFIAR